MVSSGRSPASVAPALGKSVTALKRWVRLSREGQPEGGGQPDDPVNPANYKALEARLRELERENDFLKKVSAFFAKNVGREQPCPGARATSFARVSHASLRHIGLHANRFWCPTSLV
jgi:transposase